LTLVDPKAQWLHPIHRSYQIIDELATLNIGMRTIETYGAEVMAEVMAKT
jgi:hypothetical protein